MKVRVGIIGFGLSGRYFHAPFLKSHAGFQVVGVSTSSKAEEVQAELPGTRVFASPEKLITSTEVDLIINCGPNSVHFSLSALALRSGKHVVVEKPFANSSDECRELIALARSRERILSVFQNRRWDGDFLTVQKLVRERALGDIMHFESHFDRFSPKPNPDAKWRDRPAAGSGTWLDLGAHLVDQMLVLFGAPDSVTADIFPQRPGAETDDYFHVVFGYGPRRVVLQSTSFTKTTPRFQVFGTEASYLKFGLDVQEPQLRAGGSPLDPSFGIDPSNGMITIGATSEGGLITNEPGSYRSFYAQLHACITNGGENPVTPESALAVMHLLEAAKQSAVERCTLSV